MCNIWHSRYKMVDSEFALCEPLISLQAILLGISPHPELLEQHLCLAAKISMKQGNMSFACGSMQRLQMWFASQSDGQSLGHPSPWWIREAKVLLCPPPPSLLFALLSLSLVPMRGVPARYICGKIAFLSCR